MEVNLSDVTVACCSFHAPDAFALMWESFLHHHKHLPGKPKLFVYDNGSNEDQKDYFRKYADLVIDGDNLQPHGENLTKLCEKVETPYVLTVDNDIEFMDTIVPMMLDAMQPEDVYGACLTRQYPFGTATIFGELYAAQWSPNIAMGLMKTERVKHVLRYVTFGYYMNKPRKEFFETGAMFWRVAEACGWRMAELFDLWLRVKHYGQVSLAYLPGASPEDVRVAVTRYQIIGERLTSLRGCAR